MGQDDEGDSPEHETAVVSTPADSGDGDSRTNPNDLIEGTKAWARVAKSFLYVEVSSLVLMFSCIGVWTGGYSELAYALSVSVISVAACIGIQTAEYFKPGMLEKVEKPVSLALLLWWTIGTGIITFRAPFYTVTNGYIAAWAGLYFTAHWALHIDTSRFEELDSGRKTVALLGTAGIVVVLACIWPIHIGQFLGAAAWGLAGSLVSTLLCIGLFLKFDDINGQIMKVTAALLFIIWATVAGVCTFEGPFLVAGNGFFGCWGGFLAATHFLSFVTTRENEIV